MQYRAISRLIGLLLLLFSPSMLTPIIICFIYHEADFISFFISFALTSSVGGIIWFCSRKHQTELKTRDGFLIVVLFWFVLCFFGAMPFLLTGTDAPSWTDALFETVSGLTTTGASALKDLDGLSRSLLFYRQQLQFMGGIGIVVLGVAILPILGVGGMQLYRMETPGPMKDAKLTPRITQTAKALWSIYVALTLCCAISYWCLGMNWFNALGESFGTVSTGGFSMHNESFAYYHNDVLLLVASLFMLLGGTNFALHFIAFKKRSIKNYFQDEEFRYYLGILSIASVIMVFALVKHQLYILSPHTWITSIFTIISYMTTTGFDLNLTPSWPSFIPVLVMLLMLVGGCAASTSGGIKVLRVLTLYKQSKRELIRLIHPQAIIPIKLGKQSLPESILNSMWGFISAFIALYLVLLLIFLSFGHDLESALLAISVTLSNSGAGIGNFTVYFATLDTPSKWVLIFAMLAGRLEIFSLLILFTPQFWRK